MATFLFASDIPSEGTTSYKGPLGFCKEIQKTYTLIIDNIYCVVAIYYLCFNVKYFKIPTDIV